MAVWLQIKVRGLWLGLRLELYARYVCDTKELLQLQYAACVAIKCYDFAFTYLLIDMKDVVKSAANSRQLMDSGFA